MAHRHLFVVLLLAASTPGPGPLQGQALVRGTVRDSAGQPLMHATVADDAQPGRFADTDSTGAFALCAQP